MHRLIDPLTGSIRGALFDHPVKFGFVCGVPVGWPRNSGRIEVFAKSGISASVQGGGCVFSEPVSVFPVLLRLHGWDFTMIVILPH